MPRSDFDLISARDMKPEDIIWLDGAGGGHPDIAVKTTHDEIKGMIAHLALQNVKNRPQLLKEFSGCCRMLSKTQEEKTALYKDTKEWNNFCTDIAWMACYRVVLMNAPVMIVGGEGTKYFNKKFQK